MEVVDQDDGFFADISKQISLLIMDDDDDEANAFPAHPSPSFQVFSRVIDSSSTRSHMLYNEQICTRDQSKGTGVFIPARSTNPRRKNKQGKFNNTSSNTKIGKQFNNNNSRGFNPHDHQQYLPSNNYTSFNSFNHKRT